MAGKADTCQIHLPRSGRIHVTLVESTLLDGRFSKYFSNWPKKIVILPNTNFEKLVLSATTLYKSYVQTSKYLAEYGFLELFRTYGH